MDIVPYKLKHTPTGLYYQPHKFRGSNWSKRAKIYQTKVNILNLGYHSDGSPRNILWIYAHEDTLIFKEFKDKLSWEKSTGRNEYKVATLTEDWIKEEIK